MKKDYKNKVSILHYNNNQPVWFFNKKHKKRRVY